MVVFFIVLLIVVAIGYIPIYLGLYYFNNFRSRPELPSSWKDFISEILNIRYGFESGSNDQRNSARNVFKRESLPHKIAVVTGGNRGIGPHVIEKLLRCDIKVVMGVRNPEKSKEMIEHACGREKCGDNVTYFQCDTSDMDSVREFAKKVRQSFPAIHILINNAATMWIPYSTNKEGFELHMATNYFGHFLLTHLLMPALIEGIKTNLGKNVRVINTTSCVHKCADLEFDDFHCRKHYYAANAYAVSKLALIYFTKQLEVIFKERGLQMQAHAPHPGIVNTDLYQNSPNMGIPDFKMKNFKTPEAGSRTIIYGAISPEIEGKGGTYLNNCAIEDPHPKTNDTEKMKRLFEFTCKELNIKSFGEA